MSTPPTSAAKTATTKAKPAKPSRPGRPRFTVFLDRDGVLAKTKPVLFLGRIAQWEWLPGAKEAVARLNRPDVQVCLATNQPFVATGLLRRKRLEELHAWMLEELRAAGGRLDRIEVATFPFSRRHKPRPGLLVDGGAALGADPARSVMVGDNVKDAEAAHGYGCKAMLLCTSHPRASLESAMARRGWDVPVFDGLPQAVDAIVAWIEAQAP
jgi:D-glycero-D-manno-heptose 1,7-bisphosphate phosphatase